MSDEILDVAVPAASYDWLWERHQELGADALKVVEERDRLRAENERLRQALDNIAWSMNLDQSPTIDWMRNKARAALAAKDPE